ncbi:MAG TPA: site-specific DNA-methyltransferase [Erysipelotrichaceae bacterium]|nr:site-specific DNA-methyltransferase [Erysipelotrichaceae bacterium]
MTLKRNTYYKDDKFTLLKGSSFCILKKIEPKSVDLIFADPPYFLSSGGISCQSGKQVSVNKGEWDYSKTIKDKIKYHRKWIALCRDVLKDDGTIMISSTLHSVYAIGVALELEGYSIINNIIWKKTNPAPNLACRCFTHSTETIIWARKQLTIKKKGKHYFNYEAMKEANGGKQMKDVWEFENEPEIVEVATASRSEKKYGKHPTQKPVKLLERLITAATKEGDLILDPFNGSGTTGIVATKMNRRYIGIEINKDYLELTKKRYLGGKDNGK